MASGKMSPKAGTTKGPLRKAAYRTIARLASQGAYAQA